MVEEKLLPTEALPTCVPSLYMRNVPESRTTAQWVQVVAAIVEELDNNIAVPEEKARLLQTAQEELDAIHQEQDNINLGSKQWVKF